MAENIIDSYLVRIGASTDKASFNEVIFSMKAVSDSFAKYSGEWLTNILKLQVVTSSAFASIGTAAVGLGQHMAELDQNYRLMGLHMMLPTKQARDLQQALDAVGVSLQDAIWDPESNKRVFGKDGLYDFGAQSDQLLGPRFEENMARIRKFEDTISKLRIEATSMAGGVISSLVDSLGKDGYQDYFNNLVNSMLKDGPQIVDFLSSRLQPVLENTKTIFDQTGDVAKQFGVTFTNLVGMITGDKSLEGTTFQWQKLGDAVEEVTFDISKLLGYLLVTEKAMLHLATAGELVFEKKYKEANKELQKGIADFTPQTGGIVGGGVGFVGGGVIGALGSAAAGAAIGSAVGPGGTVAGGILGGLAGIPLGAIGAGAGLVAGTGAGAIAGHLKQRYAPSEEGNRDMFGLEQMDRHHAEYLRRRDREDEEEAFPGSTKFDMDSLQKLLAKAGATYSIDPRLIRSIVDVESSDDPNKVSDKGAQGLMQLMPGTAADLKVTNPLDPEQNVMAGTKYFSWLMDHYRGDLARSVMAYNEGFANVDKGYFSKESLDYANKVLGRYQSYGGDTGTVVNHTYGDVHVTVNGSNLSAQDVARAIVNEQKRQSAMASQRAAYQNGGTFSTAR